MIRATPAGALLLVLALLAAPAQAQDADSAAAEERALAQATELAVRKLAPSVVSVEALGGLPKRFKAPKNEGEKRQGILARKGFKQAYGPSTGVIVRKDGLIVTSTFVLARKPRHLFVTTAAGTSYVAKLLGRDDSRALALLKVEAKEDLPAAELTPAPLIQVGRFSLALGRGLGGEPVVSRGIVSAVERIGGKAIQSSALISPVNYGGPLAAIDGSVMGILVPLSMQGGRASVDIYDSGIGFAIPAQDVLALLPRLARGEQLQAGFLGLVPDPSHRGEGVMVKQVAPGSPAAKAGLQPGDQVVSVDGEGTHAVWQLRRILTRHFAGEALEVVALRDDQRLTLEVTLAPPPAGPAGQGGPPPQRGPAPAPPRGGEDQGDHEHEGHEHDAPEEK